MKNLLLRLAFTVVLCKTGVAATLIAQNGPHVTFNTIPFGSSSGSGEYQQLYSASLFSGLVDITSLAFSPDTTGLYSANVTLRFTTTSVAVGSLSSNLASNYVTPLTTDFSNPLFSQNVTGGSETFSLIFNLTTPFVYNPASGNLLLDVLLSNVTYGGFGFSRSDAGPVISRAYNMTGIGNGADGVGLRTQIGFTQVPEPGTIFLIFIGLTTTLVVGFLPTGSSPKKNGPANA